MTSPTQTTVGQQVILAAERITKFYAGQDQRILVLDNITLELREGEFVTLLGPSGSGKSTLLRILAGLVAPSAGEVLVPGEPLQGPNAQVAIVFQSFALYPWLTVLQNVELGLLARDVARDDRRKQALAAIDLVGLDGFEDAYPKELSGGMKQRVGFARALVVDPEALFMDEPFSALDVLTAQNLREQLLDLWVDKTMPTRAILMVTHNIDEAVSLADRLVVLAADPGRIRADIPGLPLAVRRTKGPRGLDRPRSTVRRGGRARRKGAVPRTGAGQRRASAADRARAAGKSRAQLQRDSLLEQLQQYFSEPEARRQLDTAIDWGRYAELFAYDDDSGELYLEEETEA
jgi:ABC-type nitrate/sulfonate/bicarbonate transport system ATPase subunit